MDHTEKQNLPANLQACVLGENTRLYSVSQLSENQSALEHLLSQSTRSVDIFTHTLDHRIFDQPAVLDALCQLVVNNTRAKIQIL
ncbi:MAG: hypothetical protein R6X06_09940 [Gammaproteobacteria bacterium]